MPNHIWSILCQQVIIDRQTNTATYLNAIEALGVEGLPFVCPNITVGTLWARSKENEKFVPRVRVLTPGGDDLHIRDFQELQFGNFKRYRVNIMIGGFNIEQEGVYTILVERKYGSKWKEETRIPLPVEVAKNPQVEKQE